ncbi:hypothetical protein SDC9_140012 [bioreactor metagenome]|uniref:Uncharacterized protein n=1 Tax=bioreactor metagenome TaxID=1076179 RepID=A0A645DU57_9ZZZZ
MQLLQVGLVAAGPVRGLLRVRSPQHLEDLLQTIGIHDVPDADQVEIARRHPDHQIVLADDPQHQVELVLPLDLAGFHVLDDGRPMIGIDHRFTDCKRHTCPLSRPDSITEARDTPRIDLAAPARCG